MLWLMENSKRQISGATDKLRKPNLYSWKIANLQRFFRLFIFLVEVIYLPGYVRQMITLD